MKIKNIFFAAILVLAGFSCSMEDDAIMNDVEKGIEKATEAYTVLDFGVAFNEMATKSTTVEPDASEDATGNENEEEKKISEISVFLLEGGKVMGILRPEKVNQVSSNPDGSITLKDLKFVTKYKAGRTLEAHVVINGNQFLKDINIGDAETQLNKSISGCLSADQLIKYGSRSIVFGTDVTEHNPSPAVAENNPKTICVKVSHIAARIDFSEFRVTLKDFGDKTPIITFDEAKFVNLQQDGEIFGGYADVKVETGASLNRGTKEGTVWTNMGTVYGYANQYSAKSSSNTALYVKFTVDGRTFEKTYPINPENGDNVTNMVGHTGIKGGYLYDIKVHWTITPKWGDSSIEFYTRDWVHNTIPEIVL